jgi:hypothetical protein
LTVPCNSLSSFSFTNISFTVNTFCVLLKKYPRIKVSMSWMWVAWRRTEVVSFVVTHGCYHVSHEYICGSWSLFIWSTLLWFRHLRACTAIVERFCVRTVVGLRNGSSVNGC